MEIGVRNAKLACRGLPALLVLVLAGLQRLEMRRPHRETGIAPGTL